MLSSSLAPQEWIALLSRRVNQIESDRCIQNTWIYFVFLRHSPVEWKAFAWPLHMPHQSEQKFQVLCYHESQLKHSNWKSENFWCTLVFVWGFLQSVCLFISPPNIFVSLFRCCFGHFQLPRHSCDIIPFIAITLIILTLWSTVDCIFLMLLMMLCAVQCLYHVCGLGLCLGGFQDTQLLG